MALERRDCSFEIFIHELGLVSALDLFLVLLQLVSSLGCFFVFLF